MSRVNQKSISSTLYARIFCTNFFSAAFLCTYVEKSWQKDVHSKISLNVDVIDHRPQSKKRTNRLLELSKYDTEENAGIKWQEVTRIALKIE